MMPTNEERREVAEIMRDGTRFSVSSCAVAARLGFDCEEYESCSMCEYELAYRLADLIEPEPERTCTFSISNINDDPCDPMPTCSECGYEAEATELCEYLDGLVTYYGSYCRECGSRVVER